MTIRPFGASNVTESVTVQRVRMEIQLANANARLKTLRSEITQLENNVVTYKKRLIQLKAQERYSK